MKLVIRLEIVAEADGIVTNDVAGDQYANKIPGVVLSEDIDGTDTWALLTESITVLSVREGK